MDLYPPASPEGEANGGQVGSGNVTLGDVYAFVALPANTLLIESETLAQKNFNFPDHKSLTRVATIAACATSIPATHLMILAVTLASKI